MSDPKKKLDAPHVAPNAKVGPNSSHTEPEILQAAHFLQSGWRVAVALLAPSLLGIWIDRSFDIEPVFTIVGVIFGITLANIVAYKFVQKRFNTGGPSK